MPIYLIAKKIHITRAFHNQMRFRDISDGVIVGDPIIILTGTGRYIRILGIKRGTGYGYSLWEMAV